MIVNFAVTLSGLKNNYSKTDSTIVIILSYQNWVFNFISGFPQSTAIFSSTRTAVKWTALFWYQISTYLYIRNSIIVVHGNHKSFKFKLHCTILDLQSMKNHIRLIITLFDWISEVCMIHFDLIHFLINYQIEEKNCLYWVKVHWEKRTIG